MIEDIDNQGRYTPAAAVINDLKQFERLRALVPPLTVDEIAHRMVWPVKDVKWLLKKLRDDRQ